MGISFYISRASEANAARSQSVSRGWGREQKPLLLAGAEAGLVPGLRCSHSSRALSLGAPASHSKLLL